MLIRKNTKAFKTISEIIRVCQGRADREKLVRLYITKAGHSIQDRISVEGIQGEAGLFYEMNYQAVLNNLTSSSHQLQVSDDIPGIYFFHSSSNKVWDETPFEFDEAVKKEFSALPELPLVRKKAKAEKFVFPVPQPKKPAPVPPKKEKAAPARVARAVEQGPKQPGYKLKHKIFFTDLEKVIFRQPQATRRDVLDYYNNMADYLLPYLKDRPQSIRLHSGNRQTNIATTREDLFPKNEQEIPDWIYTATISRGKVQDRLLLCNDKDHLLFYVQAGGLEFSPSLSRVRSLERPDVMIIAIDSPESHLAKAVEVALVAKEILSGLRLPAFVKTDGMSGLHIYIPLDSKSEFEASRKAAEYICKLISLKIPDKVAFKELDAGYGKVSLDYSANAEGKSVIAPYSLVSRESAIVTAPLLWEEVRPGLLAEDFTPETIFKRLKQKGDPFEGLFSKKINADALLEQLDKHYSFMF